ncbi:conserved membrane hypothetical protein [Paraburkholderia tropica]|uniref:hypothetical protein n=1 Tax=Paraburkholderia tropica TaxID=92647 RepID=UPI001CAE19FC|nr:hypothetical protein [Paraburkholderia tropica]CAG9235754.1 conserved membrane hypothetical protein [Paraburkholderia tropica]
MDDTPDKLRRNVVALSAAILAIAFFHLTFTPTGNLLGFAQVGNVSPLKVWLALSATLVYMFLRWRYASDTEAELEAVNGLFQSLRSSLVKAHLKAEIAGYVMRGTAVTSFAAAEEFMHDGLIAQLRENGPLRDVSVDISLGRDEYEPWWSGVVNTSIFARWEGGQQYGRSDDRMPSFALNAKTRHQLMLRAIWRAAVASRVGVDMAVPFALATAATATCIYKIGFYLGQ